MTKTNLKIQIAGLILLCNCTMAVASSPYDSIKPANPIKESPQVQTLFFEPKHATLTKNDVYNQYAIALNRFMQSNVRSAYMDFEILMNNIPSSDYAYLQLASKMADIGFFNLSQLALDKIKDKDLAIILNDEIKKFYFPKTKLSNADEIYLGEIFSNIVYNDQSREATSELVKNIALMQKSDYAIYLTSLGALKSGNIEDATKYINLAISKNPENINYLKLKSEILSQSKKPQTSLKIVDEIRDRNLISVQYVDKINSLEQYLLYKTQKHDYRKNYHLGYYYFYEKDYNKAIRTLQGAVSTKKKSNIEVYALQSRVYFEMKEFEKAQDIALKVQKLDKSNVMALTVLGDVSFRNKDYESALGYYTKASSKEKGYPYALVKTAETFQQLNQEKKAKDIFARILKTHSDCYQAYYHMALFDKDRELTYLKRSIALNLMYKDAWIDMARIEIEKKNLRQAKVYLAIAGYIDENDFRYYYYQGLISKAEGFEQEANTNFQKSLKLNPLYVPAKEELSI